MDHGSARFRIGIRGRLLAFLGIAIVLIVAMEIVAQRATYKVAEEYESRLDHYHLVHRMRMDLSAFRADSDRFIRDPNSMQVEALYEAITALSALDDSIAPLEDLSIEAGFEVRATGYGLNAYFPLIAKSISYRVAGRNDYYADFVRADRIAGYVDMYLSRLLSILMRDGEESFRAAARRSKAINEAILFGMISAGILLLGYVYVVANSITKPIRNLAKASEKLAKGELNVAPIKVASRDEVGILVESFFAMSANIRAYIEGLKEKGELEKRLHDEETSLLSMGKALREAQFMNLQDQMRPHFLFNALNSIARNALLEGAPATEKLAISLAKLLRSTMKEGGPYIPLGEEVDIVREYLSFQKARFGERMDWEIRFDASLGGVRVPRFLLQPLVENAVRHGIEPKEDKTRIFISVQKKGDKIKAFVIDTGLGIASNELIRLRRIIKTSSSEVVQKSAEAGMHSVGGKQGGAEKSEVEGGLIAGAGIGLANVAMRLFILYGQEGTIQLYSKQGKGTIVRLSIPMKGVSRWPES
ncbi:MAG: histidine kinase [Spirochaetales bacterium]|jgi:sensor histidine kinase YesM